MLLDDGADAEGLGSYVINALKILLAQAQAGQAKQAKKASDTHQGGGPASGGKDVSKDAKDEKKAGSIASAKWNVQRAANGQEVEIQIECKDPKGSLTIEIWAQSADPTQDKKVKSETESASANVKKKIKLDIPADAAGTNESHFYFVVKDGQGGEKKSDPIFVDRAPFKFSI